MSTESLLQFRKKNAIVDLIKDRYYIVSHKQFFMFFMVYKIVNGLLKSPCHILIKLLFKFYLPQYTVMLLHVLNKTVGT